MVACSLILQMKLVPPSLSRSPYVPSSFRSVLQYMFWYSVCVNSFFNGRINISTPKEWNFRTACGGSLVSNFDKHRTTFYGVHGFKSSYGYM
jgi:hypothetical protein